MNLCLGVQRRRCRLLRFNSSLWVKGSEKTSCCLLRLCMSLILNASASSLIMSCLAAVISSPSLLFSINNLNRFCFSALPIAILLHPKHRVMSFHFQTPTTRSRIDHSSLTALKYINNGQQRWTREFSACIHPRQASGNCFNENAVM